MPANCAPGPFRRSSNGNILNPRPTPPPGAPVAMSAETSEEPIHLRDPRSVGLNQRMRGQLNRLVTGMPLEVSVTSAFRGQAPAGLMAPNCPARGRRFVAFSRSTCTEYVLSGEVSTSPHHTSTPAYHVITFEVTQRPPQMPYSTSLRKMSTSIHPGELSFSHEF